MFGEQWNTWWEWYGVALLFWLLGISVLFAFYGWVEYTVWKGPWSAEPISLPVLLRPRRRWQMGAALAAGVLLFLWSVQALHREPPPPATPSLDQPSSTLARETGTLMPPLHPIEKDVTSGPATPTVEDIAKSDDLMAAGAILNIWVNIAHETWQELYPADRGKLCTVGKEIRTAMKAHHNTLADLTHTERAVYDITLPADRCRQRAEREVP